MDSENTTISDYEQMEQAWREVPPGMPNGENAWIEKRQDLIDRTKMLLADKGGIDLIGPKGFRMVVRIPPRERINPLRQQLMDQEIKLPQFEMEMVGIARLWPSEDEVRRWIDGPKPMIMTSLSAEIGKAAGLSEAVTAKKL